MGCKNRNYSFMKGRTRGKNLFLHIIMNLFSNRLNTDTMKKSFALAMIAFFGLNQLNAQNFSDEKSFLNASNRGVTYTYDFEGEPVLTGWTTIDADGDGHDWFNGRQLGTEMGHDGTDGWACSESYKYPDVLTPDNYLVSRQFLASADACISFWACSHDEIYPEEHFGVAVSTSGNTDPADFTTIAEWTIPNNWNKGQSEWTEYRVDLSQYAGQLIYIAIRHFNCTDQYKLDVDDVTIIAGDYDAVAENGIEASIAPNPTQGQVTVKADGMRQIAVFNMLGQKICDLAVDANQATLDLRQLEAGVYFVRIETENGCATQRVVVGE